MAKAARDDEKVVEVLRKRGNLRRIVTSGGRGFLILKGPGTERFLETGAILDRADVEELEGDLALKAGTAYSYQLLDRRERTEQEMRRSLAEAGVEKPGTVDYIIESLKGRGYLDDRRYAGEYVRYRKDFRPSGPRLIRRKLAEVGVSEDIIEMELGEAFLPGEERRIAMNLARRKLRADRVAGREKAARRAHGFLSRRGFSTVIVNDICAGILRGDLIGADDE